MDRKSCTYERISDFSIGLILLFVGLVFTFMSFVLLPIVGLVIAVPIIVLSVAFLGARRSKACALLSERTKKIASA